MTASRCNTILFDLDGTLIDSISGLIASFEYLVAKYPQYGHVDREIVRRHVGRPFFDLWLQMTGDEARATELLEEFRQHNRKTIPDLALFSGCREMLVELRRRKFKIGLVTSKGKVSALLSLSAHGLDKEFDVVLAKEDTQWHKPRPEPLWQAIDLLESEATATAYVGDTVYDIEAAHAAGCISVAALWGAHDREGVLMTLPHLRCESAADILSAFLTPSLKQSALNTTSFLF